LGSPEPAPHGEPAARTEQAMMWTEQEGRSDLTLELEIGRQPDGTVDVRFRELHVM
jgi:hypothetical protein